MYKLREKIINNWSIVHKLDNPYTAPECRVQCLAGLVEGYSGSVTTSGIEGAREGKIVTRNTVYTLGTIDPGYEAAYPNAKERFFNTAKEV